MESTASNPLAGLAANVSLQTLRAASIVARLCGAGLAVAIAFDQSYDPTQVFASIIGGLVLVSATRTAGRREDFLAAFGAGLVFFAGAVLTHFASGLAMLAVGAFAGLAAFALAERHGRSVALPATSFVAAALFTGALQVLVVFSFE